MSRKNFSKQYGYNNVMQNWQSAWGNNVTYMHYYYFLKELALNMYKWEGLPKEIDERFLELILFEDGYGVFFKDEEIGHVFLQSLIGGRLDLYRIPIMRTAYSVNGYQKILDKSNSVLMFANYLHTTMHISIDMFARKLYNISRTIDVNVNGQKTPMLILCDNKQKLTLQNVYMQYEGNEPVIYGYKGLDTGAITSVKTDVPFVADKLEIQKSKVWNEAMLFLGINSTNMEKKERMISDEANGNLEQIMMSRQIGLNSRRKACDEINNMFGLDVSVKYNDELEKLYDKMFDEFGNVEVEEIE